MDTVTIVTLTNDQPEQLLRCLTAAASGCTEAGLEPRVVVLDIGDKRSATQRAMRATGFKNLVYVECEQWWNRARCINYGVRRAAGSSELLLLLADDAIVPDGFTPEMVATAGPRTFCGPLLVYADRTIMAAGIGLTKRIAPSYIAHLLELRFYDIACQYNAPAVSTSFLPTLPGVVQGIDLVVVPPGLPKDQSVMALPSQCVLMTRAMWDLIGGYDENLHGGSEDVDLCLRARENGIDVTLRNDVRCVCEGDSTNDLVPRMSHQDSRLFAFQPFAQKWLLGEPPRIDAVWGGGVNGAGARSE